MTIQFTENLIYKNTTFDMSAVPLASTPNLARVSGDFMIMSTACWRAYVGTWEIIDERLYLVEIDATYNNGNKVKMTDIFPESQEKVFANWFTGPVLCNCGELLDFKERIYEEELILTFSNGILVKEKTVKNAVKIKKNDQIFFLK